MTKYDLTEGLALPGLSGANLLGFLAALGVLRTATLIWGPGSVQMDWTLINSTWCPRLFLNDVIDETNLASRLATQLMAAEQLNAFQLGNDLNLEIAAYRQALQAAQQTCQPSNRQDVDFLSAFGCEAVEATTNGKSNGHISDTAFRTMSGAGHQHFLGTIRTFIVDTKEEHLRKVLFEDWQYDDPLEKHSMRWDPLDDIRYALRWANPSGDKDRKITGSMWGANRLAIEALPLFPAFPAANRLVTTGFIEQRKRHPARFTWPIWEGPVNMDCVRSLLSMSELQEPVPDRQQLSPLGIVEIFRSERITQGKFRNFTSARPV